MRYPLLASPLPPGTAGLEMATVALIRQALSTTPAATTAAVPDTTATPAKAQVKGSPFEPESLGTASSVSTSASLSTSSNVSAYSNVSTSSNSSTSSNIELEAAQTPVPSTSDPAGTALTISKPLEAKPVQRRRWSRLNKFPLSRGRSDPAMGSTARDNTGWESTGGDRPSGSRVQRRLRSHRAICQPGASKRRSTRAPD